jgi:hypothetical protein
MRIEAIKMSFSASSYLKFSEKGCILRIVLSGKFLTKCLKRRLYSLPSLISRISSISSVKKVENASF